MHDMMEWILSSSVLIVGMLLLRRALRGHISLRLQYALWLIVLVRLLCPVNLFQSGMSIHNAVVPLQNPAPQIEVVPQNLVTPPVQQESVGTPPQTSDTVTQVPDTPGQSPVQTPVQTPEQVPELPPQSSVQSDPAPAKPVDWLSLLTDLWIVGSVAMLFFILGANIQFSRMLAKNRGKLDVPNSPVAVYVSSAVKTPCLVGVFHPVIYLTPEVASDRASWNHVIFHELTHLNHFDHVFSLLRCVALSIHWYNPLVWIAARVSKDDCELACDEGTIRLLGEGERIPYGQTLIRMTTHGTNPTDLMIAATTMAGSKNALRERISLIARRPRTIAAAAVLCVTAVAIMVGCTFTGAVDPTEPEETTPPTETTAPLETTEPTAPTETTLQVIPHGYMELREAISGTNITMTVDGDLVYLQEDGLTLTLVNGSRYVYREGYLMAVMNKSLKVEEGAVFIHEDFYPDFLYCADTDTVSLFHGCYFFATEVMQALEAPVMTAYIYKLLDEVTSPASMGITIPRLEPGRVIQTSKEYNAPYGMKDDFAAMGIPARYTVTYTENQILEQSRSVADASMTNSMRNYPELNDVAPSDMTVGQFLEWQRQYHNRKGYEELADERKAFLAEKQIHYYDHHTLMEFFAWGYIERTDEELRSALEQAYTVDYEFIHSWMKDTDLRLPEVTVTVESFVNSLVSYGGTVLHADREESFPMTAANRVYLLANSVTANSWTRLENAEEPSGVYLEFRDHLGNPIRFYETGVAAIQTGGKVEYWEAAPVNEQGRYAFENLLMYYYTCEIGFENFSCTANSYQEAAQLIGSQIAARHMNAMEDSPYYALEYVVFETLFHEYVTENASIIECEVRYAIRQPELSYDGYGNVKDGTDEYEGWLVINQYFGVYQAEDGIWYCNRA